MREVYLDNAATTPADPHIARIAARAMTEDYGNPSSLHKKGLEAQLVLEHAREKLARALDCEPEEVLFTSGGTESNNLAIHGAFSAHKRRGTGIIAISAEHSSVLEPLRALEEAGASVTLVNPAQDGMADTGRLLDAVDGNTILLSCMMVNSEVGAVSPIPEIVQKAKRKNPRLLIHCDAVQAFGKLPLSAKKLGVDLLSVSGHKLHAPKGIGALYLRRGTRILPLAQGGGQERGLRPGTENVPLACAFAQAAEDKIGEMAQSLSHVTELYEYFVNKTRAMPQLCINSPGQASPYICNISVPGYRSETMLHFLAGHGVYVSNGSACSKGSDSHVLTAMGLTPSRIRSALRVSFSSRNTRADIDAFFDALALGMQQLVKSRD